MYNVPYFKAANHEEVLAFMKAHPFIMLCGIGEDGYPVATHIPVLIELREGQVFLLGHMMRKQQHTFCFTHNKLALAVFTGEHSYISASWYASPNVASTWNYKAIHAKGLLRFLNEQELYNILVKLTDHFEGSKDSPAAVANMQEEYIANNMKAIVAFEVAVTTIDHVFKMSQNKNLTDHENIIRHLQEGDAQQQYLATQMQQQKDQLF